MTKRKRYEHFGVQEYWIVDPALETVKVLRLRVPPAVRAADGSKEARGLLTTPLLPGCSVPPVEIFN